MKDRAVILIAGVAIALWTNVAWKPQIAQASPLAGGLLVDANPSETDPMAQVQSVASLSDVQSSDWAYRAVKAIVERYGILAGYSDRTFRGNQALTRYEFASAIDTALQELEQVLRVRQDEINQILEDIRTLQRLQQSFQDIAAGLNTRLDRQSDQITQLEQQQFSTTTKLTGQSVGALTFGTNAEATLVNRTRLTLSTSFTGKDLLLTQLEAGSNGFDAISLAQSHGSNLLGTEGFLADGGGLDYVGVDSTLRLSKLGYTFRPAPTLSVTIGARLAPRDFIDFNRFANDSASNFSSSFFANNPLVIQNAIDRPGGAGIALAWIPDASLPLTVRALYIAADAERTVAGLTEGGLFGDRHQGSFEVDYTFSKQLVARLQYTRASVYSVEIAAGGLNVEWFPRQNLAVFGRIGIARYEGFNGLLGRSLNLRPLTWAIGATIRNIVIPGSTAGIAIGQPFLEDDLGTGTQTNLELYYSFLLNDNISFSPIFMIVTNPSNDADNPTIWQGVVRLVFSF